MQGYTLSGQVLKAYKVNGPWLKQVWSCSRMRKPKAAVCGQGCCCCVVNLFPVKTWAAPAHYNQKVENPLIHSDIGLHTWPKAPLEQGRCLKVAELPYQQLHPLVSHSCLALLMLFRDGLKKPAPRIALRRPGRKAGHRRKHVFGLFVMRLLILLLLTGCMPRPMHWKSFQVTDHDRLSLGSFAYPEVALLPSHTTMWNWGHIARAAVEGIIESDGRDEAWQDWKTHLVHWG